MDDIPGFTDLLARARAGDHAATEELLARIRPWLEPFARQQAGANRPDGSASDLVQEAWLRAWQKLDQFQGVADEAQALAMFRAWLARIVSRLGLNAARPRRPAAYAARQVAAARRCGWGHVRRPGQWFPPRRRADAERARPGGRTGAADPRSAGPAHGPARPRHRPSALL